VVARRIVLPAASVAVASVVTIGGAVAFASGAPTTTNVTSAAATASAGVTNPDGASRAVPGARADAAAGLGTADAGREATRGPITPSAADAAAIVAAIQSSDLTGVVPPTSYRVVDIELAGSDPTWARASLLPVTDDIDRATVVLHRTESGWTPVQLGSYEVGCTLVPAQSRADLSLDCPPAAA